MSASGLFAALVRLASAYTVQSDEPAWKRYADPEPVVVRGRTLVHGGWALGMGPLIAVEQPRKGAYIRPDVVLRVSYQLSPTAGGGRTTEEASLWTWADRIRVHMIGAQAISYSTLESLNAAGGSIEWQRHELEWPAEGWVWLVTRFQLTSYLNLS